MKQSTVKLNDGQEFIIKNSNRTMMIFEEYRNRSFVNLESHTDLLWWSYSILRGSNKDKFTYTFDEYVDILDENPQILTQISAFNSSVDVIELIDEPEKDDKKK